MSQTTHDAFVAAVHEVLNKHRGEIAKERKTPMSKSTPGTTTSRPNTPLGDDPIPAAMMSLDIHDVVKSHCSDFCDGYRAGNDTPIPKKRLNCTVANLAYHIGRASWSIAQAARRAERDQKAMDLPG